MLSYENIRYSSFLPLHKLRQRKEFLAYTWPDNIASCKSLERSGFQLEHTSLNKKTFVYMCT